MKTKKIKTEKEKRRQRKRIMRVSLVIIVLLIIIVVPVIIYGNFIVSTKTYNIKSEKVPDEFVGYKILQLTDLHSLESNKAKQVVKIVKKQKIGRAHV